MRKHLENRFREVREPLRVVELAVGEGALEIELVVYEIMRDAFMLKLENAAVLVAPGERHGEIGDLLHPAAEFLADLAVERHDDPHLRTEPCERLRQAPRHLGQPAGPEEWRDLACDIQYLHVDDLLTPINITL